MTTPVVLSTSVVNQVNHAESPPISDAEWEVMKSVWDHGPLTAGEVVSRLEAQTRWHPRTIKTLLARLVKKGAVKAEPMAGATRA